MGRGIGDGVIDSAGRDTSFYGRRYRGFWIVSNIAGYEVRADPILDGDFVLRLAMANAGREFSPASALKVFVAQDRWDIEQIKAWIDGVWDFWKFPPPHDGSEEST